MKKHFSYYLFQKYFYFYIVIAFVSIVFFSSCNKEKILDDPTAQVSISTDTVLFDTVFTSLGSTTKEIRLYNPYNQTLRISKIAIENGDASQFEMNVDGISGTSFFDIDIPAKDSIYVFIKVNVDPNSSLNPFLVTDYLTITTTSQQQVVLQAYGQNAYYHNKEIICDGVWYADKPHFIIDYIYIDSICSLTIKPGCKIYTQSNYVDQEQLKGRILVKGSLNAIGKKDSLITFRGSRLEAALSASPGQWNGIELLYQSGTSEITYAEIYGATIGIKIDSLPASAGQYNVLLNQVRISNISSSAILGFTAKLKANNLLVSNCYGQSLSFILGGDIEINHSTIVNGRDKGLLGFSNNLTINNVVYGVAPFVGKFSNSIFYGFYENEIIYNENPTASMTYNFYNCLVKTSDNSSSPNYTNCVFNQDPEYVNIEENDFHLKTSSPCVNSGITSLFIPIDLEGKSRDAQPDMGCYEF